MSRITVSELAGITASLGQLSIPSGHEFLVNGKLELDRTDYVQLPTGTTAQRPSSPNPGYIRWNTTTAQVEVWDGHIWFTVVDNSISINVETNGLLVYLDANNSASWTAGSTVWNDISGNGNNYTLYGAPTYDSTDSSLQFTAPGQEYATRNLDLTGTNAVTVECAAKVSSLDANVMIFEHTANWNSNSGAFGAFMNSKGGYSAADGSTDNWIHTNSAVGAKDFQVSSTTAYGLYAFVFQSGQQPLCYYNGTLVTTTARSNSNTFSNFANATNYLATRGGTSFHEQEDANRELDLGYYRLYTRALSAAEILSNYNASKSQYGL